MGGKVAAAVVLTIWVLCGFYFGAAGLMRADFDIQLERLNEERAGADAEELSQKIQIDDATYSNLIEAKQALLEEPIQRYFPWLLDLPHLVGLLFAGCGFGALGGVTRVLARLSLKKEELSLMAAAVDPLFGALMGILALGVSYVLPSALVTGETVLNPTSLLFFCLFSGVFADEFYTGIKSRFGARMSKNGED